MDEKIREAYLTLQKAIDAKDPIPKNVENRKPCNALLRNAKATRNLQDLGVYLGCVK